MASNEQRAWAFLKSKGFNDYAAAGIMGNLYAESGIRPDNLQNNYEKKLGLTDTEYTAAVDNGSYTNFVHDSAGYGLAQWTYYSRKQNLLSYAQAKGVSIADLDMQLEYLYKELSSSVVIMDILREANTVREASDCILLKFERPADQSEAARVKRAGYSQTFYDRYTKTSSTAAANNEGGKMITKDFIAGNINGIAINSTIKAAAANYKAESQRSVKYIVMHYTGNTKDTAVANAKYFANGSRQASAHFFVDDSNIYQSVGLKNTAWHCGSNTYYHKECRNSNSFGIEMCCTAGNYKISATTKENAAYLCAYLCKMLGIAAGAVSKYVVRHYDVTGKKCPAEMAGENNAEWAKFLEDVAKILGGSAPEHNEPVQQPTFKATGTAVTTANLRMRAGAGTSFSTLLIVNKGCTVQVDSTVVNGWYHCKYGNVVGYMSGNYLKNVQTTSSTPAATRTHKVKSGDTLSQIAKKYGTTVNAIVLANRSKYPKITASYIVVGWELVV